MKPALRFAMLALALAAAHPSLSAQVASPPASTAAAPAEPTLDQLRAATERFRDVRVAISAGYVRDPMNMCMTAEMVGRPAAEGGMGVHYVRADLLGISAPPRPRLGGTSTYTSFLEPAILIYEPQADGSEVLVAIEGRVFIRAWEAAGHSRPPSFHGVPYDAMIDDASTPVDEAHGFEPHYDRHIWLYRPNPSGIFAPFNPAVSCRHHGPAGAHPG